MKGLLAVLGQDVRNSLSPRLHMAAAAACGLDIRYLALSCPREADFFEMVDVLRTLQARGCNVTIPYKVQAFEMADEQSEAALALGVANTLKFEDGKILADNTDGLGLKRVLEDLHPSCLRKVQILGAGGAARAAVWAAAALGAKEIVVCARRNAELVAGLAPDTGRGSDLKPVEGVSLVISSLPNDPKLAEEALNHWIDLRDRPTLVDLAYGGLERQSPLTELAEAKNLAAQDGRGMLVEQAALSLATWIGGQVSENIRTAMWEALV